MRNDGADSDVLDISHQDARELQRIETQRAWDARLLTVLTSEWQASGDIALALAATKSTVHEQLKDMMLRGLAKRKVVRMSAQSVSSKTRTRQHYQRVAMFRLARPERQRL